MKLAKATERELGSLYDDLARYQWWRRRFTKATDGEGLEMHKRLNPSESDGPGAGTSALHDWLWEKLDLNDDLGVLDVGCGFGASLFSIAKRAPRARLEGISLSPYQIRVATNQSKRLGLGERGNFHVRSFDSEFENGPFDLMLSIETLFHAPELANTLANLKAGLAPGGRIALVEDMAVSNEVAESEDGRELLRTWSTCNLYTEQDYMSALANSGLTVTESVDLTAQVPHREAAELDASSRRLRRIRNLAPTGGLRRILDAFIGGIHLERLYDTGRMNYRCMIVSS